MTELKPCPFCGSPAHVEESMSGGIFWIECEECHARSQICFGKNPCDAIIEAWNRRVTE